MVVFLKSPLMNDSPITSWIIPEIVQVQYNIAWSPVVVSSSDVSFLATWLCPGIHCMQTSLWTKVVTVFHTNFDAKKIDFRAAWLSTQIVIDLSTLPQSRAGHLKIVYISD